MPARLAVVVAAAFVLLQHGYAATAPLNGSHLTHMADDIKRYIGVGIYPGQGPNTPARREAVYDGGRKMFDYQLTFQPVYELRYDEIEAIFASGREPILNMEFWMEDRTNTDPVLQHIVAGLFDAPLASFAQVCAAAGRRFTIRTLHEFNGNWYQWGLLYNAHDPTADKNTVHQLRESFSRIIGIFEHHGAPIDFQLNINSNNGYDDPRPFSDFWPGTQGLSSVAITSYNRAFSTPAHNFSESFGEGFQASYYQANLPVWVAETGTTSYGTDKPDWYRDAFKTIALQFPRVEQVTFFLYNKVLEGKNLDWDLNTPEDIKGFVDGYYAMRSLTA
ncbi:glycoside hydrolase superfamily [Tribonema minus]|uniref:Glycoside hydrolase superfamily n=1 Tax=Tribonema minus TaxID=303371 RepID=A0A835YT36_9STRA|nr:glycoside hydrolase superfamily [Tribonema minus]